MGEEKEKYNRLLLGEMLRNEKKSHLMTMCFMLFSFDNAWRIHLKMKSWTPHAS